MRETTLSTSREGGQVCNREHIPSITSFVVVNDFAFIVQRNKKKLIGDVELCEYHLVVLMSHVAWNSRPTSVNFPNLVTFNKTLNCVNLSDYTTGD